MKRIIAVFLSLILCSGLFLPVYAAQSYRLGDVNGDALINAQDALLILRCAVGKADLHPAALTAADVTGQAAPNAQDALCVLQKAVGRLHYFPVETTEIPFRSPVGELPHSVLSQAAFGRITQPVSHVALLCSYQDYLTYKQNNPDMCLKEYGTDYFAAGHSLLLFVKKTDSGAFRAEVERVYVANGALQVEIKLPYSEMITHDLVTKLYHVELDIRPQAITAVHCFVADSHWADGRVQTSLYEMDFPMNDPGAPGN